MNIVSLFNISFFVHYCSTSKQKYKDTLLELACGEGGDMNRWIDNSYKFVLGIDYVKNKYSKHWYKRNPCRHGLFYKAVLV